MTDAPQTGTGDFPLPRERSEWVIDIYWVIDWLRNEVEWSDEASRDKSLHAIGRLVSAAAELDELREALDTERRLFALECATHRETIAAHEQTKRELEELREQLRFVDTDRVGLAMDQEQLRTRLDSAEGLLRKDEHVTQELYDQICAHFARYGGREGDGRE